MATVEGYVTAAETHGGGWVQLLDPPPLQPVRPLLDDGSDFTSFVNWLQGEVASGRVIRMTTDQVIGGTVQPPVAP